MLYHVSKGNGLEKEESMMVFNNEIKDIKCKSKPYSGKN